MGNLSSKPKEPVTVKSVLPGYTLPAPPEVCIDDIRPPIPWYQNENDDDFDWSDIETQSTSTAEIKDGPQYYVASRKPSAVLRVPTSLSKQSSNSSSRSDAFIHQKRYQDLLQRNKLSIAPLGPQSLHTRLKRHTPLFAKISFESVDTHARKAGKHQSKTFESLVKYLTEPIGNHQLYDLLLARALIIWLANQNVGKSLTITPTIDTPEGLLQLLAHEVVSHADTYTILCRRAGLQCVIIEGYSKSVETELSDKDAVIGEDIWTAVRVAQEWQIVHPFWICKGQHGYGGSFSEWINREISTKTSPEVINNLKRSIKSFVNEDFFMPSPEVYVHFCIADDIKWQMLPPELVIKSRDEFISLPLAFPPFFRLGFILLSEARYVLRSRDGMCKIVIGCEREDAHKFTLTYDLKLVESKHPNTDTLTSNLRRLVFHSRHNKMFYFEIRFPIEGIYKLEIQGGYNGLHYMRLCQFQLICDKRLPNFKYLPYDPGTLMWGPGNTCNDVGLVLPSKPTGSIYYYPYKKGPLVNNVNETVSYPHKTLSFQLHAELKKTTEYTADLIGYSPDKTSDDVTPFNTDGTLKARSKKGNKSKDNQLHPSKMNYSNFIACERSMSGRHLNIIVKVPHSGEFALLVKARPFRAFRNGVKRYGETKIVCAYLVRTVDEGHRENATHKAVRAELQASLNGDDRTAIHTAVDKCLGKGIYRNDDDVIAGQTKLEYLTLKKELNDAVHRRNIKIVNDALRKVSHYRYKGALLYEIQRVFKLRTQLKRLQDLCQEIPFLKEAAKEIINMEYTPSAVHMTMAALLLLLEESELVIDSWEYVIRTLTHMENKQVEPIIFRKMHLISEVFPSNNTRRKILALLTEFDLNTVRRASPAAAMFHIWVQKVMAILQDVTLDLDSHLGAVDTPREEEPVVPSLVHTETSDDQIPTLDIS